MLLVFCSAMVFVEGLGANSWLLLAVKHGKPCWCIDTVQVQETVISLKNIGF